MLENSSDIFVDSSAICFDPINHHENNFNHHFPNSDPHHHLNQHFISMEQQQFPLINNHNNNEQQQQSLTLMFENNINNNNNNNNNDNNNYLTTSTAAAPDLLNLFKLPKCSSSSLSSSISFSNHPTTLHQVMCHDHHHHPPDAAALLPPSQPPPFFKELLINSLSNGGGFNLTAGGCGSIFGDLVDMETSAAVGHDHYYQSFHQAAATASDVDHNNILEFCSGKGIRNNNNKDTKHLPTEKHRRLQLNGKFDALKRLVPNPTKPDRASVVGDAIDYINELKRTVEELKILVERKRCSRGSRMMKRHKTDEQDSTLDVESIYTNGNGNGNGNGDNNDQQQCYNGNYSSSTMRTSWLQRKSKNTEIDVRIIDDEVTIKLVQQKRPINCLLLVSKVLDELQLDLHHVAGGLIGDFYSYLFNTKICEGSSVYASAIANKLIEVVDKQVEN